MLFCPTLQGLRPGSLVLAVFLIIAVSGCKPRSAENSAAPGQPKPRRGESFGYFQTHFQDESQFIVENLAADLAEMIHFAQRRQLPSAKDFSVAAKEKPGSQFGAPVYQVRIVLDSKTTPVETEVAIDAPIWSGSPYEPLVASLADAVGLERPVGAKGENDTALLRALTRPTAEVIEEENMSLSAALEDSFLDPVLHEKAALLLAAFTLREHTGDFLDIRWPLGRIGAHLAFSRFLAGDQPMGINGQLANAALETLMNNQSRALQMLKGINSSDPAVASWVRALQARNTGDYRALGEGKNSTPFERIEWFRALAHSVDPDTAWPKLSETEKQGVSDFCRIANEENYSVEVGHELLQLSIRLEMAEISKVHSLSRRAELTQANAVKALNVLPARCFATDDPKRARVRVIGWGTWAAFLQRQLCHAVQANFNFMQNKWGVPDDAKEFSKKCEDMFGGLRLYPFVRRFNCTTREEYHKSVDDGFRITVATPHLSPPQCWNFLCYVAVGEHYRPNPNPHVNEWHKHNPPPGTAYNLEPRLNHPSLVERKDSAQRLDTLLREIAPYDTILKTYLVNTRYKRNPSYDEAIAMYRPILDYSTYAMALVARTAQDQPARYEELTAKAAALDADYYFSLADYFQRSNEPKALQYFEKANAAGANSIRMTTYASWAIRAYLRKGQTEKARQIADTAGEVYSSAGLEAKAEFLEATGKPAEAFEWFVKNEERYNESGPLMRFCVRHKQKTGDSRFDAELQKRLRQLFPRGVEKVTLADFKTPPTDGVVVQEENELTRKAGLKFGDVIVGTYGIRVHNFAQYGYAREISDQPELTLIVWQGNAYREIRASPPNRRFGAEFGTYRRQ
jgi:tetratricopeptide (TPR) repeat protein